MNTMRSEASKLDLDPVNAEPNLICFKHFSGLPQRTLGAVITP